MTTFKGFDDFASRAPKMLRRAMQVAGESTKRQAIQGMAMRMETLNPPRSSREHTHFVDSWFWAVDGRKVGRGYPQGTKPGSRISRGNDSPHARVLDGGLTVTGRGRRRLVDAGTFRAAADALGKTVDLRGKTAGRRIGTPSAPRGYSKPALLFVRSRKDRYIERAIREANRHL